MTGDQGSIVLGRMRMAVTWRPGKHCSGSDEDSCYLETREILSWMRRECLLPGGSENNYYIGEGTGASWGGDNTVTWRIRAQCGMSEQRPLVPGEAVPTLI